MGSEGGETRVATRAYAVRQGDTTRTLKQISSERGLDYDEVRQLNPAVATRNGLLKAGDVLKLPNEKGSSAAKRAADAVDDTTTASEPSTAPPATADDTNAPVVGEDITPADAPRGDSRDAPADDTTGPVHPGTARASRDGDDDAGSAIVGGRGSSRTPPPPSSTPGMPPASPDDRAYPSLDEVREDMRRRGVSAVRGIGGVVGAVVKTAGASVGAVREAAAASSAVLRESSEDLRRTSDWVNSEVTGIATKAGEEIENLRRSRPAGTKDSSLDASDSPVTLDASDSPAAVSKTPPAVSKTPPTPPSSPARRTLAERVEARAERRRAAEAE